MIRVLNQLGCHVRYDREILRGMLWSGMRSDAIAGCSLFVHIHTKSEWGSHILLTNYYFADLLNKPVLFIEMDDEEFCWYDSGSTNVAGRPEDPDFSEKCRRALERRGFYEVGSQSVLGTERPDGPKYDLGLSFFLEYEDRARLNKREQLINCNLRTRGATDFRGNSIPPLTDEDLYTAIKWKRECFFLLPKNRADDYQLQEEDRRFMNRLLEHIGKPIPEIAAEYAQKKAELESYWNSYPYMDEFEYMDSLSNE